MVLLSIFFIFLKFFLLILPFKIYLIKNYSFFRIFTNFENNLGYLRFFICHSLLNLFFYTNFILN